MNPLPYIMTEDMITLVKEDGVPYSVDSSHKMFDTLKICIKNHDWDEVNNILTAPEQIAAELKVEDNDIVVEHGHVYMNGEPLNGYLINCIVSNHENGFDVAPLLNFLANLMNNPSHRAVNDLYKFLEHNNLPITPDGHFMAYKGIRFDWKDYHSGKMDNSIGAVVTMPRNKVDENPDQTCSYGLHACGSHYLKDAYFSSQRVVLVKINPADVVAFPKDYNNSKLRCCRYEVIKEVQDTTSLDEGGVYKTETKLTPQIASEAYEECGQNMTKAAEYVEEYYGIKTTRHSIRRALNKCK